MMRWLPLIVFVLLIAVGAGGMLMRGAPKPQAAVGKPLAEFSIERLGGGEPFTPAAWGGKPAIINIFATWCEPCKAEHPLLERIATESGLPVYGIAWRDKAEKVEAYLRERGNPFKAVGVDEKAGATVALGLTGVPETMMVDAQGVVRWKFAGALNERILKEELLPMAEKYRAP